MFIQTIQPKHQCSKCGSLTSFNWDDEFHLVTGTMTKNTWRQCSTCGHKKIESTLTVATLGEPSLYNIPEQPSIIKF